MIKKRSLADEVAVRLQQQITSGVFKVGDKLPIELQLMKSFGVGRSSVREAIKILANRGLLSVQQGVGTFVESQVALSEPLGQRLKRADIKDLDEVRKLLELKIAEKAAENYTAKHIEKMKAYLAARNRAAQSGDLAGAIKADIHFHITIAEASGNEILLDLYKAAATHVEAWFLQIYNDTLPFIQSQQLHEQLLKYIKKQDAKAAWNTATAIIDHV
ncbi:FadR/GntR family transcriptional regulator [Arachidicoccus terrestris]|uniref:FadR/GntR family transcriptional regulator n=1 Tax=Arachidicoccus terrestris TaxID=2875539 RepID=UPI001CC49FB6|nr:FadR/GntR family transcriptional regulator [Arachidicoccus terrestris]UAY55322.1 FadR family transcriptional regulator [Arachidicoccus terrestris]